MNRLPPIKVQLKQLSYSHSLILECKNSHLPHKENIENRVQPCVVAQFDPTGHARLELPVHSFQESCCLCPRTHRVEATVPGFALAQGELKAVAYPFPHLLQRSGEEPLGRLVQNCKVQCMVSTYFAPPFGALRLRLQTQAPPGTTLSGSVNSTSPSPAPENPAQAGKTPGPQADQSR